MIAMMGIIVSYQQESLHIFSGYRLFPVRFGKNIGENLPILHCKNCEKKIFH